MEQEEESRRGLREEKREKGKMRGKKEAETEKEKNLFQELAKREYRDMEKSTIMQSQGGAQAVSIYNFSPVHKKKISLESPVQLSAKKVRMEEQKKRYKLKELRRQEAVSFEEQMGEGEVGLTLLELMESHEESLSSENIKQILKLEKSSEGMSQVEKKVLSWMGKRSLCDVLTVGQYWLYKEYGTPYQKRKETKFYDQILGEILSILQKKLEQQKKEKNVVIEFIKRIPRISKQVFEILDSIDGKEGKKEEQSEQVLEAYRYLIVNNLG